MTDNTIAERVTADYTKLVQELYRNGDKSKPMLPAGQMEDQLTRLKVTYASALLELEKQAKQQKLAADDLEARSRQDPAHHLSDGELQSYQVRRSIVSEDAANMDILDFLRNARAAANSGNKAVALAHLKSMPEGETIPQQREIEQVSALLKGVITPPDLQNASERAQEIRLNAEIERVAAKSALHDLVETPGTPFNPFE